MMGQAQREVQARTCLLARRQQLACLHAPLPRQPAHATAAAEQLSHLTSCSCGSPQWQQRLSRTTADCRWPIVSSSSARVVRDSCRSTFRLFHCLTGTAHTFSTRDPDLSVHVSLCVNMPPFTPPAPLLLEAYIFLCFLLLFCVLLTACSKIDIRHNTMRSVSHAPRLCKRAVETACSKKHIRPSSVFSTPSVPHSLLRALWSGACLHHATDLHPHPIQPPHRRLRSFSTVPSAAPSSLLTPAVQQLQGRIANLLYNVQHSQLPTPLPAATTSLLGSARHTLTQPFLLVIVGEYNSSKSSLINALVGQPLLAVGPLPTTEHIYIIQHSQQASNGTGSTADDDSFADNSSSTPIRTITASSPLLQSVSIVDTPGTNALSREHEQLTTSFLPRADLLLLVTSADRPFSESERAFLQHTQQWRKKCVLVLGKIDLLATDDERWQVVDYVARGAAEVLGEQPTVLVASTKQGAQGVRAVEEFITRSLTATDRLHLKLSSPLLVAQRVLSDRDEEVRLLEALVARKAAVLQQVERLSANYAVAMEDELSRQWTRVHNVFARLQQRSIEWVGEKGKLSRVAEWLRDDMAVKYEREVQQWTDVQSEVQAALLALLDGLGERSERYVQDVRRIVVEGEEDMAAERQHRLLQSMQGAVGDILSAEMDGSTRSPLSSAAISASLSSSLFTSAALHTGALSLAVSSLLSLSFLDFTGLLSSLLVVGGLGWLPWRRSRLVEEVKGKVVEMEARVHGVVRREVAVERERVERQVARWMDDMRRGVERERGALTASTAEVGVERMECQKLLREVNDWKTAAAGSTS